MKNMLVLMKYTQTHPHTRVRFKTTQGGFTQVRVRVRNYGYRVRVRVREGQV